MEFGLLGPVDVRRDGSPVAVGGPKPRAVLAMLLLEANKVVSRDRLIEGLWGERQPPTAEHTLDDYISRLRKALGSDRIERRAPGYVVCVEHDELDLTQFEVLVEQGREQLARGEAAGAAATLRNALSLWRGQALADLLNEPFASLEADRLEERRLSALEDRVDADLALGQHSKLVAELEELARRHPYRERLASQLMLALYRSGRQAEALATFQSARQTLAKELGLEPGPELRELQRRILEHDPGLGLPRSVRSAPKTQWRRSRRKVVAGGVAAVAVAAAGTVALVLASDGTHTSSVRPSDSNQIVGLSLGSDAPRSVPLTGAPAAIAAEEGSLWVADPGAGTVSRVDLDEEAVVDRVPLGGSPSAVAVGGGSIWVTGVPGETVVRIDANTGTMTQRLRLGGARASALAVHKKRLWIADITDNALLEVDSDSGVTRRTVTLGLHPTALAIDESGIWVADYEASSIAEVEPRTGRTIATIRVGNGPVAIATGLGAVWVANSLDSTVSRVDPTRSTVAATIPVGSGPSAIAVAGGSVWVASQYSSSVSRIDPARNAVVETRSVGGGPTALAAADGRIWAGVRPLVQHRGGTLTLLHTRPISIDPALHLDLFPPVSDGLARSGLVTYNHVSGSAGIQLVPNLAVSLPVPIDGGRTYTFRLRSGIRYSDGREVRAADFRRALERAFRVHSPGTDLFANIVGADACLDLSSTACDLSPGIVTDERSRTVIFHLRAPDSGFLANLTVGGLATPVPPGTPFHDSGFRPIPGTGPYMISSASSREVRYVRNPVFREWSHAAQPNGNPDEIVMRFGLTPEQEVREIQEGRADWMADAVPASLLPELARRFPAQLHVNPVTETDFFQLNTTVPPFDDVRARRAFNLAIDRRVIVRLYGGREAARPTCQVLPPGLRGYRPYCPYTRTPRSDGTWTAPDVARARRLVAASGTRGAQVTVWGWTDDPTISARVVRYTADVLRRLGYRARVRLVPHSYFDNPPAGVFKMIQLIPAAWVETSAYSFVAQWMSCTGATNHGWFCDGRLDREMLGARSLESTNPRAATTVWSRIDRALVDQAAWVPLVNPRLIDFVSARVRNYQFHPYWGIIADQLSVQ
jgi:YVTN family beta-propeller protein